jgi:hypothetical protein
MTELIESLKYIFPAIIVMLTAYWLLKQFFEQERIKLAARQKEITAENILKMRLQAYERVVLFLERIRPRNLLLRSDFSQIDAVALQGLLIENIRIEYEHNLVQQLYISADAWDKLNLARGWVVNLLKETAAKMAETSTANDFAIRIIELEMTTASNPVDDAISFLKNETGKLF